jgi:RNA-binding protein YlmH
MNRQNIDKIAQNDEDRILLAKIYDKISAGIQKNCPASGSFLSPRQKQMAQYLLGNEPGVCYYGGYEDAERTVPVFLPEYFVPELLEEDGPLVCLRATFYKPDSPTHRDFLGALIGTGVAREAIGDILVGPESCDFFVLKTVAPYILQNLDSVGRTSIKLQQICFSQLKLPPVQIEEIRDTVASLRLDSIISSGFRISRSAATEYIYSGRAAINGLVCDKPDKPVGEGSTIAVRGLGKVLLHSTGNLTKKGRIPVTVHRYI